jgi:hypothetical protein
MPLRDRVCAARDSQGGISWSGATDVQTMTPHDPQHPAPPARWRGLLSPDDWRRAVEAIGAERLDELHPMLERVSPAFRARFLAHLTDLGPRLPAGRAVLLAVARASHDAAEHTRAVRLRAGRDR